MIFPLSVSETIEVILAYMHKVCRVRIIVTYRMKYRAVHSGIRRSLSSHDALAA